MWANHISTTIRNGWNLRNQELKRNKNLLIQLLKAGKRNITLTSQAFSPALEVRLQSLTVVAVMSLRRSGISDLLGLLALLTIGLEGGRLWLPITLQLALREGIRPSRSSRSPVLVGLLLGCMTGMEGPPLLWRTAERRHRETHIRNILYVWHGRTNNTHAQLVTEHFQGKNNIILQDIMLVLEDFMQ